MCGRIFVKSTFAELMAAVAGVPRGSNLPTIDLDPRQKGAPPLGYPNQELVFPFVTTAQGLTELP